MKQLLVSWMPFSITPQMIQESLEKNNGRLIVSGVLQRANSTNQNGRVYPKPVLQREAEKYAGTFVSERRALGELDHPESSVVNLANVSHNVLEMKWDGDDLIGKVEVLGTPAGNILKELFRSGIKLGISSRGLGSVQESAQNQTVVQDDFELIAFDFVSNPSTHGAFLSPITESKKNTPHTKYEKANHIITEILVGMEK